MHQEPERSRKGEKREEGHRSLSTAPYHIRKYRERDRKCVVGFFFTGVNKHTLTTFLQLLKLPRALVLLPGGPLTQLLLSGSWLLMVLSLSLSLLCALWFFAKYPWRKYEDRTLLTDMSDITKSYLSERGSCFLVAESEEKVLGMVGALPVDDPTLREMQLRLLHLFVDIEHRHRRRAKALVRTVLPFARDQGYSEVVLGMNTVQFSALALYQGMGFQEMDQSYHTMSRRLVAVPRVHFIYHLPSAQAGGL
ncbi:N-acetyltransferase 8-like [Cebus imitator]|uniref:N-acetyltransferase 8-like n=1 Tax=Cebus imitator TaxID=2715852 RepID=UPI00189826DC|nr:N-acetyltransferase 8-like [Cebus imitator]